MALLLFTLGGSTQASALGIFREVDGLVVVEAEAFHSKANTSQRDWYVFPTTAKTPKPDPDGPHAGGAGGGQYVEILPDTRVTHDDPLEHGVSFFATGAGAPRLGYQVQIDTPGRYYVRIRAFSTGTEDNSVHVGVDNTWPLSGTAVQWCDGKNQWTWSGARRVPENHCGIENGVYLDLTAGERTIMIAMREDGFEMDRFVLTLDPDYFPTGVGPAVPPEPPQLVVQPEAAVSGEVGESVTLSVVVTGEEPVAYQWIKDGEELEGATGSALTLAGLAESDAGRYVVRVSNAGGTVLSEEAVVTVVVPMPTLWGLLESEGQLSTFKRMVEAAGWVERLEGEAVFTVFAPNNNAFGGLAEGALEDLLADTDRLAVVLAYHLLGGGMVEAELEEGVYPTVQGAQVVVTGHEAGVLRINNVAVVGVDLLAVNGVVHIIEAVLLPPEPADTALIQRVTLEDGSLTITWTAGGEIETAPDANGPWESTGNVSGSYSEPIGVGTRFFRVRVGW